LLAALEREPGGDGDARRRTRSLLRSDDRLVRAVARRAARDAGFASDEELPREEDEMADEIVDRLFALERVDVFEGLPAGDLVAIAALAREVTVPVGERIYAEGDTGESLFVIVAGEVELTHGDQVVLQLGAGESLGQTSFLDRGPRPVSATARGNVPARLLSIERGAFLDLMTDRPGLMQGMFTVLAARLRALIDREPGRALG
jgi:CRP-like cAMP-binding protein